MITQDSIKNATVEQLKEYTQQTYNLVMSGQLDNDTYYKIKEAIEERAEELNISEDLKAVFEFQEKSIQEAAAEDKAYKLPPYFYTSEDGKKVLVSTPLLAEYIRRKEHYIFEYNAGRNIANRFWYENGVYKPISDSSIKGKIKNYIEKHCPTSLKMRDVDEVFKNITTDLSFVGENELNNDENIINFQNGILHLDTMQMTKHSPKVFSTIQIPCNWTGKELSCPVFDNFMNDLTQGNEEIKCLLMQFIGVCISNVKGFRMKQALFMCGDGNTGKSQLKSLVELLLGSDNYISIDLSDLEERFGTSYLYGKRLAGSSDMSFVSVKELKTFKNATGGDSIFAEYKGKQGFSFTYNGLLWFCMNKLPKFGGDRGPWVYDRIIVVNCKNVIPLEKRDRHLCDKMFAEREAIVYKAVQALKEVIANGCKFSIPEECKLANEQYRRDNSPVQRFFDECCMPCGNKNRNDTHKAKYVYDVFRNWCKDNNGGFTPSKQDFKEEIAARMKISVEDAYFRNKHGIFYSVMLNSEAELLYNF